MQMLSPRNNSKRLKSRRIVPKSAIGSKNKLTVNIADVLSLPCESSRSGSASDRKH